MDKRDTERGYSTSDIIHEYENMDPTEDYDAFNEDTFGNNVETWTKEDHDQLVGAHVTEGAGADFFALDGGDDLDDETLLGGALEPEGAETVEENGGKVHYLLEEDIEVEDMVDGSSHDFGHGDNIEANGHALSSNFSQKLHLDQNLEQHVQQPSNQANNSPEVGMNMGQGSMPSPHGNSSILQGNAAASESQIQQAHGSACPQHPHHFHHTGHQHDLAGATQQPSTVIFAAAPPGHQMAMPVIAGFPPAPNLQLHSGVPQPVLALPPGHQAYPHALAHAQAIHIHNHQGHPYHPQASQQGPNIHLLHSPVHPTHSMAISNNNTSTAPANNQQEFTDPAIMSVSKIPPPRASALQNGSDNSFPTNIMQINSKGSDVPYHHGHKPTIPSTSNVKSVQDLEREMMAGPPKKPQNLQQPINAPNQYNRPQGYMYNRPGYNAQLPRQSHHGMRNNQPHQHFVRGGGNGYHQRFVNHQGNYNRVNNSSSSANSFDDKNRDTFGEDFVMDHQIQQQARQQRYHYGEREQNNRRVNGLITPGHVHVLGILRGARENHPKSAIPAEPTGNPHLDMQQQRKQDRNTHGDFLFNNKEDEYSNLMSLRERQWIVNIQLNQLKCENPFLDDYYYTVFNQKLKSSDSSNVENALKGEKEEIKITGESSQNERNVDIKESGEKENSSTISKPQVKRTEEGAQLLLPAESKLADGSSGVNIVNNSGDGYTPKQFSNSLGCLQAVTVKAPRKIIDVGTMIDGQDPNTSGCSQNITNQKDTKNFKQTLIELERLYDILIEVEDCEKKLTALPTGTSMRLQVEGELSQAIKRIRSGSLAETSRLKKYIMVRKGKALLVRALRHLEEENMKIFCNTLFPILALAARKDRDDQMLGLLWDGGLGRYLNSPVVRTFDLSYGYLSLICTGSQGTLTNSSSRANSKSPPPENTKSGLSNVKSVVATPLGVAVIASCVHNLSLMLQKDEMKSKESSFQTWMSQLASEVGECKEVTKLNGVGINLNEPLLVPSFLTTAEKKCFAKIVATIQHNE